MSGTSNVIIDKPVSEVALPVPKRIPLVTAFGLDALLSTGVKSEMEFVEPQILRAKSAGLVYNWYMKIMGDIMLRKNEVPAAFTYSAMMEFYGLNS